MCTGVCRLSFPEHSVMSIRLFDAAWLTMMSVLTALSCTVCSAEPCASSACMRLRVLDIKSQYQHFAVCDEVKISSARLRVHGAHAKDSIFRQRKKQHVTEPSRAMLIWMAWQSALTQLGTPCQHAECTWRLVKMWLLADLEEEAPGYRSCLPLYD